MVNLAAGKLVYQSVDMNATYVASEAVNGDNVCSIAGYLTGWVGKLSLSEDPEPWW